MSKRTEVFQMEVTINVGKEVGGGKKIRVELAQESVVSNTPASVRVYQGEELVTEVVAEIVLQQGADGGHYNAVALVENQPEDPR